MLDITDKLTLEKLVLQPDTVEILNWQYFGCYNLKNIVFNNRLKKIGDSAFTNCMQLESIELPNSLETIGIEAFHRCINLKHVKFPENIKTIQPLCFYRCTSLREICLPKNMKQVDLEAFDPIAVNTLKVGKQMLTEKFLNECKMYFKNISVLTYDD